MSPELTTDASSFKTPEGANGEGAKRNIMDLVKAFPLNIKHKQKEFFVSQSPIAPYTNVPLLISCISNALWGRGM